MNDLSNQSAFLTDAQTIEKIEREIIPALSQPGALAGYAFVNGETGESYRAETPPELETERTKIVKRLQNQVNLTRLPDWIIEAISLLYTKEQQGDKTAAECKEALRQTIRDQYDGAVSKAKEQSAELAESVSDDLSFGLYTLGESHTYAAADASTIGKNSPKLADEFLKPYAILCAAHAISLINADDILRQWWENEVATKQRAPRAMAQPLEDAAITQTPNDPASALFGEVIARLSSWKTNENECFKYAQKGKSIVSFHLEEEMTDSFNEQLLQTLDARFAAMKGDLVADVADILFWHWYANKRPAYAEITLSQILEYRRKIKPGPDTIKEHWQAMRDVRAIKLRGGGVESESLFHISAAQFKEENATNLKTVYRYHPGYFLSEAIQRDAFYIAYFARSVWQLDYYRDADAKRLARVLRAEWRRNPANYLPPSHSLAQTPRYRTWKSLLSDAGIDYEGGRAESNPAKFIKAIESELEKLYSKAEFIRDCAPACYHPDDREKRENLPRYNPLKTWLSLRTHIAPDADITDLLAQTTTRQARKAQLKALAESKKHTPRRRKKAK